MNVFHREQNDVLSKQRWLILEVYLEQGDTVDDFREVIFNWYHEYALSATGGPFRVDVYGGKLPDSKFHERADLIVNDEGQRGQFEAFLVGLKAAKLIQAFQ